MQREISQRKEKWKYKGATMCREKWVCSYNTDKHNAKKKEVKQKQQEMWRPKLPTQETTTINETKEQDNKFTSVFNQPKCLLLNKIHNVQYFPTYRKY